MKKLFSIKNDFLVKKSVGEKKILSKKSFGEKENVVQKIVGKKNFQ